MGGQRNLIIGTAGHIDHGKTVLVKALTGRDTDRLAEEKKRGISIDLGFAPMRLSDGSVVGIVDVPGHENFVRNMMAGATGVDLALLVVAADDGVMPQTREHLAILDLLGVTRAVVAVTKADLVEEELIPLVAEEVDELLEGTALEGSPVIPVSAVTGQGIEELKAEIERAAGQVRLKDEALPVRLPIDRVFSLKGIGTVVTGTLWSGQIAAGDTLELLPSGRQARIRSLEVHDEERETARAGERTAANLAGVTKSEVARGDVLVAPGTSRPTYMLDARVTILEDSKPLKRGVRLRFHHGTREVLGRMYPLDLERIEPGEQHPAQLRLESQAVVAPGDRFVLRSYSPVTTIGGGTVVDAHPSKHRRKDPRALDEFERLESGDLEKSVAIYLKRAGGPVSGKDLVLVSGIPPSEIESNLEALAGRAEALKLGDKGSRTFVSSDVADEAREGIRQGLERFRKEDRLAEGMEKETLKKKTLASWDTRSADLFLEGLIAAGVLEAEGKLVRLPGESAAVTDQQARLLDDVVARIEKSGASPPTLSELAPEMGLEKRVLSQLLALAEKEGQVIRVSPELYFSPGAVRRIEKMLREALAGADGITVSDFKNLIGTSRKFALPLLEYFDRTKVTVRAGDLRRLR